MKSKGSNSLNPAEGLSLAGARASESLILLLLLLTGGKKEEEGTSIWKPDMGKGLGARNRRAQSGMCEGAVSRRSSL